MTSFETLLVKLAGALDRAGIDYIIIGGQAVLLHGEPRQTGDIDVTLALDSGQVEAVIAKLGAIHLKPLPPDPSAFARKTNVLPMEDHETGLRVDVVFSEFPYEREAIRRAEVVAVGGGSVRFVSAEDLVVHKLVAGRPIDIQDVRGIWLRKGPTLDAAYIERWLEQFAAVPGLESVKEAWRQAKRR